MSHRIPQQLEARRKAVKAYVQRNPGFVSAKKKRYNKRNPSKVREKRLLKRYGINNSQFEEMVKSQANKCAICGCTAENPIKDLVVDHCHKTNKVRKLLCNHCNQGIGLLKENVVVLKSAITYLEEHNEKANKPIDTSD